jgi:hypothetical protein
MKMLYFSAERSEIEIVYKELQEAGIPCEVRDPANPDSDVKKSSDTELWIKNDQDSHKALLLCVQLGVGFGKPVPKPVIEEEEEEEERGGDGESMNYEV